MTDQSDSQFMSPYEVVEPVDASQMEEIKCLFKVLKCLNSRLSRPMEADERIQLETDIQKIEHELQSLGVCQFANNTDKQSEVYAATTNTGTCRDSFSNEENTDQPSIGCEAIISRIILGTTFRDENGRSSPQALGLHARVLEGCLLSGISKSSSELGTHRKEITTRSQSAEPKTPSCTPRVHDPVSTPISQREDPDMVNLDYLPEWKEFVNDSTTIEENVFNGDEKIEISPWEDNNENSATAVNSQRQTKHCLRSGPRRRKTKTKNEEKPRILSDPKLLVTIPGIKNITKPKPKRVSDLPVHMDDIGAAFEEFLSVRLSKGLNSM